jgi:hypothetical protein
MMGDVDASAGMVLRWCRALLLGTVALIAGVAGHLGADGLMPGRPAIVLLFVTCTAGAALFLGRPASRLRVVLLLAGGQTFIHGGLTSLAGHRGDPPLVRAPAAAPSVAPPFGTTDGRRVGSLLDQFYAAQSASGSGSGRVELVVPSPVQHLIADLTGPHAAMAVGHLAAAVVVGLWLAMGEKALWAIFALTGDLAARVIDATVRAWLTAVGAAHLAATLSTPGSRPPVGRRLLFAGRRLALARSLVRRGPPSVVATRLV